LKNPKFFAPKSADVHIWRTPYLSCTSLGERFRNSMSLACWSYL